MPAHGRSAAPTPVDDLAVAGAFDYATVRGRQLRLCRCHPQAHPIHSKAQKNAQLAVETDAEYAEQCHLLRGIIGYPFAP